MCRTLSAGSMGSVRKFGTGEEAVGQDESRYLFVGDGSHSGINHPRLPNPLGNDLVQPLDGRSVQPVRDLPTS